MRDPLNAIHACLTAIMAWLYVALMLPPSTFDLSPGYHVFRAVAPETVWAALFGLAAGAGSVGLVSTNTVFKRVSIFVIATMHGTVSGFAAWGAPKDTWTGWLPITWAPGVYGCIAALGYWLCWVRR